VPVPAGKRALAWVSIVLSFSSCLLVFSTS
jgi:hypothetical protein